MIINHLLNFAQQRPSTNHNERPKIDISLLVIHNISLPPGQFGADYIESFFTNQLNIDAHPYFKTIQDLHISAHLLIKRDGLIVQFVPFDKRAWHAGDSHFKGKNNCNDFSIGIELEGDDNSAYEKIQYVVLNKVITLLKAHYPIVDIVGHNDIAPGRKTDPGPLFDWSKVA